MEHPPPDAAELSPLERCEVAAAMVKMYAGARYGAECAFFDSAYRPNGWFIMLMVGGILNGGQVCDDETPIDEIPGRVDKAAAYLGVARRALP